MEKIEEPGDAMGDNCQATELIFAKLATENCRWTAQSRIPVQQPSESGNFRKGKQCKTEQTQQGWLRLIDNTNITLHYNSHLTIHLKSKPALVNFYSLTWNS